MNTITIQSHKREWKKCKKYFDEVQGDLYRMNLCVTRYDEDNYLVHIGPCESEFDIWMRDMYEGLE